MCIVCGGRLKLESYDAASKFGIFMVNTMLILDTQTDSFIVRIIISQSSRDKGGI